MRSIRETAFAFDRACRSAEVSYAVVGGFAVMAWGQPRATTDVDALVALSHDEIPRFVGALATEGLTLQPGDLEDVVREGGHATAFDEQSSFHVDLKHARTPEERKEVDGAIDLALSDGRLRVATAEDTVAYKLLFGSEQDLQDARSILFRQGAALDRDRIRTLAARLGVLDAWDRMEAEVRDAMTDP